MASSSTFSSRTARSRRRSIAEINVVPYIDVLLVLLVIFMAAAPLVAPSVVHLPTVSQAAPQQTVPPITVTVELNGALSVRYQDNGVVHTQTLSKEALNTFLHQRLQASQKANEIQPVVIAADERVAYKTVMAVMSDVKQQGFKRVALLVKAL